jgi:hypothetical protein
VTGPQSETVVELGFTGRSAGQGSGPYTGLNLGGHVGDNGSSVEANRRRLAASMGVPRERLLFLEQVHGREVVTASGPWASSAPSADAVVTAEPDLAVAVLVADCVPVLLHDATAGVVGAVHAGRPGMSSGVVAAAVTRMRELGASAISAVVGPSVCGRCYEVPAEMAAAAASLSPAAAARSWTGTPAIDVAAGVVSQLAEQQVTVHWVAGCTREHPDLYSYRRDGVTGRFAGVVVARRTAS